MSENKYKYGREIVYNMRSCHAISAAVYLHWLDKIDKEEQLTIPIVIESVTCYNCNGWGYTLLPNGKRDKHCTVCDGSNVR